MRWYKKWYTAEWQEIDTDYIKQTHCVDPRDKREHLISQVSLDHMYCAKAEVLAEPGSANTAILSTLLVISIILHLV